MGQAYCRVQSLVDITAAAAAQIILHDRSDDIHYNSSLSIFAVRCDTLEIINPLDVRRSWAGTGCCSWPGTRHYQSPCSWRLVGAVVRHHYLVLLVRSDVLRRLRDVKLRIVDVELESHCLCKHIAECDRCRRPGSHCKRTLNTQRLTTVVIAKLS